MHELACAAAGPCKAFVGLLLLRFQCYLWLVDFYLVVLRDFMLGVKVKSFLNGV